MAHQLSKLQTRYEFLFRDLKTVAETAARMALNDDGISSVEPKMDNSTFLKNIYHSIKQIPVRMRDVMDGVHVNPQENRTYIDMLYDLKEMNGGVYITTIAEKSNDLLGVLLEEYRDVVRGSSSVNVGNAYRKANTFLNLMNINHTGSVI